MLEGGRGPAFVEGCGLDGAHRGDVLQHHWADHKLQGHREMVAIARRLKRAGSIAAMARVTAYVGKGGPV
jgi:hypothetical protein